MFIVKETKGDVKIGLLGWRLGTTLVRIKVYTVMNHANLNRTRWMDGRIDR